MTDDLENRFDMKKDLEIVESRGAVHLIIVNKEAKEKVYSHKSGPIVVSDEAFEGDYSETFTVAKNGEEIADPEVSSPVGVWRMETGEPLEDACQADIFFEEEVSQGDTLTVYWKEGDLE